MSITKWEPFREMEDLFGRYGRLLGWTPVRREGAQEIMTTADWTPMVNVSETEEEYLVEAELPEVKKEDIKVTVNQGVLTVSGERRQEKEQKGRKFHRVERAYGSFTRSFTLPEAVDETRVSAEHKNGILKVRLPKMATEKPKSIEVKIG